jgi:CzcA family heavy metal efflux pump
MMRWIVGSSLHFRFLVLACAVGMMAFGVARLREMPVDVFPEFAPPRVEIQTEALGLSTSEVESLVTVPLEEALSGTPQLDVMRSKSVPGLSSVLLIFKPGTDLIAARQLVQERLATAVPTLPNVSRPPHMLAPLSATSRVMKIGISSKDLDMIQLSELNRWTIRPRLMTVPGVANVAVWGMRKSQLQVQVEPERLAANGLTLTQVMDTTADAVDVGLLTYSNGNSIGTGGFIDTPNQRLPVRHVLPIGSADDLSQVVVKVDQDGNPLRLGDISTISLNHPLLIGDGVINDGPGLLLIVEKFPWGNTLEVTRGVEAALDSLKPALTGVDVDSTIFRPATFIEHALENLSAALLLGCLLVILVLGAFLFEWRTALVSLAAIPLSLVAAGLVLYLRGATINTMILAGFVIALGSVVDDAIIDVENIVRRLRENRRLGYVKSTASVILEASLEVRSAIVFATLIIVVAVVPVIFMEGLSGAFFQPLAVSYGLALLVSMLVALTVTPALSLILLANAKLDTREPPLMRLLGQWYQRVLASVIHKPRPAYAAVAAMVVVSLVMLPFLGQTLLPKFKETDFLMHWVTQPGTSLPEMQRITVESSRQLRSVDGVRNFGAHMGRAVAADEVVGVNFTENWVSVDPKKNYDSTVRSIQSVVDEYPGLYRDVQTYLQERVKEVLTGASDSIIVRVFGPDLDVLRDKTAGVKAALAGVEGISDLHVELVTEEPQLQVKADLAAAQRYGLKPGDIVRAAATLVNGIEVGDIFANGKVFDINVLGTPAARHSLTDIQEMLIDTPAGEQVRLKDVADVRVVPSPNVIKRESASRRIDVGANVKDRDLGAVVSDVEKRLQTVNFPREYHAELLGEYAERQAAQNRMLALAIGAAVGIFLLLHLAFGRWRLAAVCFLALPIALVGGVIGAFVGGGTISLGSLVGFLTVLGIAARNGIMLILHYQHLEKHEGEQFGPALILRGARERLAPIMMTALATGLALVPLVWAGNIPGHEIEHPMAIVILGGLVTSTLLNLFLVPTLYLRVGQARVAAASPVRSAVPAGALA